MKVSSSMISHAPILADVVGEIYLDDYKFFIIKLNKDNNQQPQITAADEASAFTELLRFEVNGQLCAIIRSESAAGDSDRALAEILTDRELQIASLVAMGRLNKQIADKLHISEWTVATHLRRIFAKLGVRSRAAMVYRCASLIEKTTPEKNRMPAGDFLLNSAQNSVPSTHPFY